MYKIKPVEEFPELVEVNDVKIDLEIKETIVIGLDSVIEDNEVMEK